MYRYMRLIKSEEDATDFLTNILLYRRNSKELAYLSKRLFEAEIGFHKVFAKSTLDNVDFRHAGFEDMSIRTELWKTIKSDLLNLPIAENDETIRLGYGGGLPACQIPSCDKRAFYIIGLPGAGKTTLGKLYSQRYNAVLLDCDYAKRKLPEYNTIYGACLTHEESRRIVWGRSNQDRESIFYNCLNEGYNLVITKIGNEPDIIKINTDTLCKYGYSVSLILCRARREIASLRSFERFLMTGRYISLPLIFDWYADSPTISYYDTISNYHQFFDYQINDTD